MTSFSSHTLSELVAFLATRSVYLEPCSFAPIVGWKDEDVCEAFSAFIVASIMQNRPNRRVLCPGRPFLEPLEKLQCHIASLFPSDILEYESGLHNIQEYARSSHPRSFFETYFIPYGISHTGENKRLITAYYEPEYSGSSVACGHYKMPLL